MSLVLHYRLPHLMIVVAIVAMASMLTIWFRAARKPHLLRQAAAAGRLEEVKQLLSQGVNPSVKDGWGGTAIMYAAVQGHADVVQTLLDSGVNVNQRSRFGRTPLMHAAYSGRLCVVELLVARGALPDLADEEGRTAKQLALRRGNSDIVSFFNVHHGP